MKYRFFVCAVTMAVGLISTGVLARTNDYLRGYLDALLDDRFPGLGISIYELGEQNSVTVAAGACLGPGQQRRVEQLLLSTGSVKHVRWHPSVDCEAEPPPADAANTLDIRLLPEDELFAPLLADPRQPRFSMSYQRYRTPTRDFSAAAVAFGEYFGIASGFFGRSGASQVGVQGAVFALFNLDAPSKDLINADYWIGLPVSYRRGQWSVIARMYHQSSHLGDEFILGNPGVDRVNLSYEDAEVIVSYERERLRFYGGGGYIMHSEPEVAREHLQAGIEYVRSAVLAGLDFSAAFDVQASAELDWARSRSFIAGFELRRKTRRRTALMLEHFRGHSPNGQFFRERLTYTGLGLHFGF